LWVALVMSSQSNQSSSTCRASRARRVKRVELCCSTMSTQPKCIGSTHQTCRVESCWVKPSGIWAIHTLVKNDHLWQYEWSRQLTKPTTTRHAQHKHQLWFCNLFIYIFIIFINWFIKCHQLKTSEAPFLHRDGWSRLWYSLHLPTVGWSGWVGLSRWQTSLRSSPIPVLTGLNVA